MHGEDKELTADELVKLAQKGASADTRYQEAAKIKREAEKAVEFLEGLKSLRDGFDEGTFRRVAAELGMDKDAVEEMVVSATADQDPPPGKRGKVKVADEGPRNVRFGDLDSELKSVFVDITKDRQEMALRMALEKDEVLGYTVKKRPETLAKLMAHAQKVFRRRIAETPPTADRTRLVEDTISEVRADLKELGTLYNPTPPTGLGPAPRGDSPDFYPKKKPDRVKATEPGYEDRITKLIGHFVQAGAAAD